MINKSTSIPCPLCGNKIEIDTQQLLTGKTFGCLTNDCDAVIGLAEESKPRVNEAFDKWNDLKSKGKK